MSWLNNTVWQYCSQGAAQHCSRILNNLEQVLDACPAELVLDKEFIFFLQLFKRPHVTKKVFLCKDLEQSGVLNADRFFLNLSKLVPSTQPVKGKSGPVSSLYIWNEIFGSPTEAKHGGQWSPKSRQSLLFTYVKAAQGD